MTAICGGGTSSAQSGYGALVYMVPSAIGALLNNIPTAWAVPLAGYIGYMSFNMATFCADDPPPVPTITALDVAQLLAPFQNGGGGEALEKFQQLVSAFAWYELCKCDSVDTPAPPTPPAAPTGMPSLNPPGVAPSYPTGQACDVLRLNAHLTPPNGNNVASPPTTPVHPGASSAVLAVTPSRPITSADGTGWQVLLNCFNSAGTFISNPVFYGESSTGTGGTLTANLPAGTASYRLNISNFNVASPIDVEAVCQIFCGSPLSGPVPQPCPTDPFVLGILDQILQLVKLIQRQKVPFATVPQSTHTGLTGDGSISVSGAIGAKFTVTTIPPGSGLQEGDIDAIYDIGWFNWNGPDGATPRAWIECSPQVSYPEGAGVFTSLSYSLLPGAVVDCVILSREF